MKRIVRLVATALILSIYQMVAQQPIYTLQDGKIIPSPDFVEPVDDYFNNATYTMWDRVLDVQVGNTTYNIRVGNYTPQRCEGDFNLIEIYSDAMKRKLYKDGSGILKMNNTSYMWYPRAAMANYRLSSYSKNGYFIEMPLNESTKAIIFIGQSYGTDVGKLFIFVLTESDAELVFNLPMSIAMFAQMNDYTKLIVQSNYGTEISCDVWLPPTMHTIYTRGGDGILMFKNNREE